jgi:hypothetical protein
MAPDPDFRFRFRLQPPHPFSALYGLSVLIVYLVPYYLATRGGEPCTDSGIEIAALVPSVAGHFLLHTFYCLWLIDCVLERKFRGVDDPSILPSFGGALALNGSFSGWSAYFSLRLSFQLAAALLVYLFGPACEVQYHRRLNLALSVDALITTLLFIGSWAKYRVFESSRLAPDDSKSD